MNKTTIKLVIQIEIKIQKSKSSVLGWAVIHIIIYSIDSILYTCLRYAHLRTPMRVAVVVRVAYTYRNFRPFRR